MLYLLVGIIVFVVFVVIMYKSKVKKASAEMMNNANEAINDAQQNFKIELDYSEKSIESVDTILQSFHENYEKDKTKVDITNVSRIYGSYIGEVVKRNSQYATWLIKRDPETGNTTYKLKVDSADMFPVDLCRKRIENGSEDNIVHKLNVMKSVA